TFNSGHILFQNMTKNPLPKAHLERHHILGPSVHPQPNGWYFEDIAFLQWRILSFLYVIHKGKVHQEVTPFHCDTYKKNKRDLKVKNNKKHNDATSKRAQPEEELMSVTCKAVTSKGSVLGSGEQREHQLKMDKEEKELSKVHVKNTEIENTRLVLKVQTLKQLEVGKKAASLISKKRSAGCKYKTENEQVVTEAFKNTHLLSMGSHQLLQPRQADELAEMVLGWKEQEKSADKVKPELAAVRAIQTSIGRERQRHKWANFITQSADGHVTAAPGTPTGQQTDGADGASSQPKPQGPGQHLPEHRGQGCGDQPAGKPRGPGICCSSSLTVSTVNIPSHWDQSQFQEHVGSRQRAAGLGGLCKLIFIT
ncbi:Tax1-binding protein 1, partial [Galemys pyrenaicus]